MALSPLQKRLLTKAQQDYADARVLIQREIINNDSPGNNIDISSAVERSTSLLGDYATLDWRHRSDIQALMFRIRSYAQDPSRTRPLNIIMQAQPGSGKSHFINSIAESSRLSGIVSAVTFNMAGMQNIDDLMQPLDGIRNLKVIDRTPILFLDEFDSKPDNYATLLPLLWDGELHVGHRNLKTGKVVIILAASGDTIQEAMKEAKSMQSVAKGDGNKLIDLVSRINGGEILIPDLDEVAGERDRRTDKVCIAVALLQHRFDEELQSVPWSLLRFIATTKFRYGVRSITHLVELLPPPVKDDPSIKLDKLPLSTSQRLKDSSLAYHLVSEDGPAAVADWKRFYEQKAVVRIAKETGEDEIPF